MSAAPLLKLEKYGVAFGERVILSSVDLNVPSRGTFVLMGPAGTGKSTLLRSLAGLTDAAPSFRRWGAAQYAGVPLEQGNSPALVAQNARLMMANVLENLMHSIPERADLTVAQQRALAVRLLQRAGIDELTHALDQPVVELPLVVQRHLAIARTTASNPALVCIDEPTADLSQTEADPLLQYIGEEGSRRAVLVVVHNQRHARTLGGRTALLAGGSIQECRTTEAFFSQPHHEVTRNFVRTGSCALPSPGAKVEDLDDTVTAPAPVLPAEATRFVSDAFGPRGFLWLKKGLLAGTPRPGIVLDIDYDLKALARVGIRTLVSLTRAPVDPGQLAPYGIHGLWFPITDMDAPMPADAEQMCAHVAQLIRNGEPVAYHCKAGLGRTGTMLAAQLVWEGSTALDALEQVRRIEPRWVQSDEQVAFLERFARSVATKRGDVVVEEAGLN